MLPTRCSFPVFSVRGRIEDEGRIGVTLHNHIYAGNGGWDDVDYCPIIFLSFPIRLSFPTSGLESMENRERPCILPHDQAYGQSSDGHHLLRL